MLEKGIYLKQDELDALFEAVREREMASELALNQMLKDQIAAVLPKLISLPGENQGDAEAQL